MSDKKERLVPKGIVWPYILLTTLFFAWAIPNNMTDTMLAAFKRIMSLSDAKTAWIQVVCYLLGYGCCALPGAMFIKRYSYKSGVILGLGTYALGAILFYPAMRISQVNIGIGFYMYLLAIFILFAGLSVLETSANSYIYALGPESNATRRLNFSQSFNPFGAITGVVVSQIFVLSNLNRMSASERAALSPEQLTAIQSNELVAVTRTYVILGIIMAILLLAIIFTRMPNFREGESKMDLKGTLHRLFHNKNYVTSVIAQFFYMGAQIGVWSFVIRYAIQQLNLDGVVAGLGPAASTDQVIAALRNVEPVSSGFYNICDFLGLDALLPRTAEQAGATYYIMSLCLFVLCRFLCTYLMKWFKPRNLLAVFAGLGVFFCLSAVYSKGLYGVYALMCISGCMSLMFPTIYGIGMTGLGEDTKVGGSGMVMAIAGAAVLTQIQGIFSDHTGSIQTAFWIPAIAFGVVLLYAVIAKRFEPKTSDINI